MNKINELKLFIKATNQSIIVKAENDKLDHYQTNNMSISI